MISSSCSCAVWAQYGQLSSAQNFALVYQACRLSDICDFWSRTENAKAYLGSGYYSLLLHKRHYIYMYFQLQKFMLQSV